MSITIAGISFDHHHDDDDDETGTVIGLTLLHVRHTLEQDGRLTLTLPPEHLEPTRWSRYSRPHDWLSIKDFAVPAVR